MVATLSSSRTATAPATMTSWEATARSPTLSGSTASHSADRVSHLWAHGDAQIGMLKTPKREASTLTVAFLQEINGVNDFVPICK